MNCKWKLFFWNKLWFKKIQNEFSSKTCKSIGTRRRWIIAMADMANQQHLSSTHLYSWTGASGIRGGMWTHTPSRMQRKLHTTTFAHPLTHSTHFQTYTAVRHNTYLFIIFALHTHTHTHVGIISKKDNDQRNRKHHCYQPLVPKYHPAECSDIWVQ